MLIFCVEILEKMLIKQQILLPFKKQQNLHCVRKNCRSRVVVRLFYAGFFNLFDSVAFAFLPEAFA